MSKSNQVLKQVNSDHIFGTHRQRKVTTTTFGKNGVTCWLLCLINKFKKNVFTIGKKNNCSRLPLFLLMEMDTHRIWQLTWLILNKILQLQFPKWRILRQGQLSIEQFANRCHPSCLRSGGHLHLHYAFHHLCIQIIDRFPVLFIINVIIVPLLIYLLPL